MSGPPAGVSPFPASFLHANQGDKILGTMIALIALASTFVALRLISRHLARAGFWVSKLLFPIQGKTEPLTNGFSC